MEQSFFSGRLRELRIARGLTQPALAKELGLLKQRVNNWELGIALPPLEMAISLADYFDVSLDYLAGRSDDPARR